MYPFDNGEEEVEENAELYKVDTIKDADFRLYFFMCEFVAHGLIFI